MFSCGRGNNDYMIPRTCSSCKSEHLNRYHSWKCSACKRFLAYGNYFEQEVVCSNSQKHFFGEEELILKGLRAFSEEFTLSI